MQRGRLRLTKKNDPGDGSDFAFSEVDNPRSGVVDAVGNVAIERFSQRGRLSQLSKSRRFPEN